LPTQEAHFYEQVIGVKDLFLVLAVLIHEAEAARGSFQCFERHLDLSVTGAGKCVDHLRHRPDLILAYLRSSDAFTCRSTRQAIS
jgi:hypothetical protein